MKTKIGGQAVIEGVMMRGESSMALSVRDELGNIRTETTRLSARKPWYRKVPFLRGIVNLVISMIDGTKIIGKSAEVMAEEEIDTSGNGMGWIMGVSMLLGVFLAIALFVGLPVAVTSGFFALTGLDKQHFAWLKSLLEGVVKMAVLIGYMAGISKMKEIRRVFMYHGAEHKTISCYEHELPLTVENVQKSSRYHDRCGTSFIVFVVVLSVVLMMVLDIVCNAVGFTLFIENGWLRFLLKIALLPLTAGISYEMLMLLARSDFILFRPLKWLGKQFQRLTTREPDDDMCLVAINSFQKVLEMDADATVPEERFPKPLDSQQFLTVVQQSKLPELTGVRNIRWLAAAILKIKPEDLQKKLSIPFGWTFRLQKMEQRIESGEPMQYVIGREEFFKRDYYVCPDVLIPRRETELVCEQLLKRVSQSMSVLDLCCGSGVLGITAALEKGSKATLADVDKKALAVAKFNAKYNNAKVKFVHSNMFSAINGKFDAIVCNPPYIPTDDIDKLDDSVKNYEPHLALDGGRDGLEFYWRLANEAHKHLNAEGLIVMEIGYDQGKAVERMFVDKYDVHVLKDYSGNDRIVVAELKRC